MAFESIIQRAVDYMVAQKLNQILSKQ